MNKFLSFFFRKPPSILYKYRQWEDNHHKDVILKGLFFLSNPKSFEDEFDCSIPLDFESIKDRDIRKRYLFYSKLKHPQYTLKQHKKVVESWFNKGILRDIRECRKIEKTIFDRFDKQAGVLSFALNPDLDEMWVKYAKNYKGFCVGIDFKRLRRETKLFDSYGFVTYKKELPSISPLVNQRTEVRTWTTQISTKLKKWEFEKEYRIFKMAFNHPLSIKDRIIIIPPEYIKEVILGFNMDKETRIEIIEITKDKYPSAKIFVAEKKGEKVIIKTIDSIL